MFATLAFLLACQPEPTTAVEAPAANPAETTEASVPSTHPIGTDDPGANDAALMAKYTVDIEANPDSAEAWYNRGHHHIVLRRWVEAEADLKQAISLSDPPALAHKDLAGAQLSQRNFEDALTNIEHYLSMVADDAEGYHMRGFCRKSTGDIPGAIEDAQKACEMGIEKDCRIVTWLENQLANADESDDTETP